MYYTEKCAVLMYISPSQFSAAIENTGKISECFTRTEIKRELMLIAVSELIL
jgi:hypothetical protein